MAAKLDKEQAAIVTAFTGFLIGSFADLQTFTEAKMGRPVLTDEFATSKLWAELKELVTADFVAISPDAE